MRNYLLGVLTPFVIAGLWYFVGKGIWKRMLKDERKAHDCHRVQTGSVG